MTGYFIEQEYVDVDVVRKFRDMIIFAPLILITKELENKILSYKDDDELLIVKSNFDINPGRQTIQSVQTYKECLYALIKQ